MYLCRLFHSLAPDGDTVISSWNSMSRVGLMNFTVDSADFAVLFHASAITDDHFPTPSYWEQFNLVISGRIELDTGYAFDDLIQSGSHIGGGVGGFPTFDSTGSPVWLSRLFEGQILDGHRAAITTNTVGGAITTDTIPFPQE